LRSLAIIPDKHFCSVFGVNKFEYIQIYPAFIGLKPNQNYSTVSDCV